ncbi:MAG: hypothetical protein M1817_004363 [Caeruleum heppii]|nr:MAG: hypothetical protein M1817_004363 [Caeruleum heppii]
MVRLLNLEDDTSEPSNDARSSSNWDPWRQYNSSIISHSTERSSSLVQPSPIISSEQPTGLEAAVACYPIILEIAHHLDLITLESLARTNRRISSNILPFRRQLVAGSLRCKTQARLQEWAEGHGSAKQDGELKAAEGVEQFYEMRCARDLVRDCRRCGDRVCRNCIIKPPPSPVFPDRHRRLCPTCLTAPLWAHTHPPHLLSSAGAPVEPTFTTPAFIRNPCTCASTSTASDGVWLCSPCGHNIHTDDRIYRQVWQWRLRYSRNMFYGLNPGIGQGDQGVKCGRHKDCLAKEEVEVECAAEGNVRESKIDLSDPYDEADGFGVFTSAVPGDLWDGGSVIDPPSSLSTAETSQPPADAPVTMSPSALPTSTITTPPQTTTPSYHIHETHLHGLSNPIQTLTRRRTLVGAVVDETLVPDTRTTGTPKRSANETDAGPSAPTSVTHLLRREIGGGTRSWCGWCWRVVVEAERDNGVEEGRDDEEGAEKGGMVGGGMERGVAVRGWGRV